jgi:PAS domain S-box-containing protein
MSIAQNDPAAHFADETRPPAEGISAAHSVAPHEEFAETVQRTKADAAPPQAVEDEISAREEADRARQLLAAIVDSSDDAIISKTLDGVITSWNAGAERIFGYTAEEVTGKSVTILIPEERLHEEREILARLGRGERMDHFETVRRTKDGRLVDISLTVSPVRDSQGRLIGASKIARDITHRRNAVAELRQSEARFRQLANSIPQLMWTTDAQGRADYFNDRWYEYTGFEKSAGGDESWLPILHPDDRQRTLEAFYECVRSGREYVIEYRFKDRFTGGYRWFLGRGTPMRDEQGKIIKWFGTCTDIDYTKRAEERVKLLNEAAGHLLATDEPQEMVRGLFERVREHIGIDLYINYAAEEGDSLHLLSWAGIPNATAQGIARLAFGESICGTVAASRRAMVVNDLQHSADPLVGVAKELGVRCVVCNPLLAGHRLLGTLSFASRTRDRFTDDELDFIRTLCHYVAIACERVRLLEELRLADRRKDEFLATLAHELRNPLAPISSSLEILRLGGGTGESNARVHAMMGRQVEHLVRLVDDLLEVSRITSGKILLRKEEVDLAAVIRGAIDSSLPLIEKSHHVLTVSLPPQKIVLEGDPVRLSQIFVNLLNNAAKYTEDHGEIDIRVHRNGGEIVICIRDNGMGIPPAMLPRVFDMFAQVDRTLSRSQGGLGIGLALARRLVEMHGGKIEARSGGLGRGSEFRVHLPVASVAEVKAPSGPQEAETPAAGRRRRILVVDDNRDAATALQLFLKLLKHDTRVAFNGLQAIEVAEEFRPDMILMDIGMPEMDGFEAARRIREKGWSAGTQMVALTGWGQEDDRRRSRESGFDHHFTKPLNTDDLLQLLEPAATH